MVRMWKYGRYACIACFGLCMGFISRAMDVDVCQMEASVLAESVAKEAHIQISGREYIKGRIDLHAHEEKPEDILHLISEITGTPLTKEGEVFVFWPKQEGIYEEVYVLPLKYVRNQEVEQVLKELIPKGHICSLPTENKLLVRTTPLFMKKLRHLLPHIDCVPQQVMVDIEVVAVHHEKDKERGITWQIVSPNDKKQVSLKEAVHDALHPSYLPNVTLTQYGGHTKLIAHPTMMAMHGEEAYILIGDKVPVLIETQANGQTKTTTEYEEAGISLRYTPYIGEDGYIDASIEAKVSTPHLVPEMKAYRIMTREAKTRVRLKDGETLRIGGLMDKREEYVAQKVPLLGDIPLLGELFQYHRKQGTDVELCLLVTAHILPKFRESVV